MGRPTADQIADMADRGEDISMHFTNSGVMKAPVARVIQEVLEECPKQEYSNFMLIMGGLILALLALALVLGVVALVGILLGEIREIFSSYKSRRW